MQNNEYTHLLFPDLPKFTSIAYLFAAIRVNALLKIYITNGRKGYKLREQLKTGKSGFSENGC